ncbi:S8 family peptidase [Paenibacillus senegalensis]|uniref:S8 family peptidase n=1 Tax=Paenibacillus senegalensis TaxID=1465766 RepID=UPI000287D484|nr:S8 family peptidase [Paenibacillus senegalensis]
MKTKTVALVLVIVMLAVFPLGCQNNQETAPLTPDQELAQKHQLVAQDVRMTEQLSRQHALTQMELTAKHLSSVEPAAVQEELNKLQTLYPSLMEVVWSSVTQRDGQRAAKPGQDPEVLTALNPYIKQAKQETVAGSTFISEPLVIKDTTYRILGVPADQGHSLVAVLKQDYLKDIEVKQKQNLRTIPYPAEGNWKMESVEAGTLQEKDVIDPDENGYTSHYNINEVVVKFKQAPTPEQMQQIQQDIQAVAQPQKLLDETYVFQSNAMEAKQLISYFQKYDIYYAEPHYLYLTNTQPGNGGEYRTPAEETADIVPNDELYSRYQWNLPIIATEEGWQVDRGSDDVTIAVIDTGVDMNHPDLRDRLLPGLNVVAQNNNPQDDVGHGSHVAGIIAASTNNGIGVAGMTWYNSILPVKVLDASGSGSTYAVAQGIIWATDRGAKVINLSLGNYADAQFLHDAVRYAYDRDVVLIAASGNDNTSQPGYPAAYPEVLAVAATDSSKRRASFSNYGDYIDVAAPGVSIASTYTGQQYAALSGTSMASPHVAALAALIRSVNPLLTNTEVMDIIRYSAEDLGPQGKDAQFGYGQIDVNQAVQMALQGRESAANWQQWLKRKIFRTESQYLPSR